MSKSGGAEREEAGEGKAGRRGEERRKKKEKGDGNELDKEEQGVVKRKRRRAIRSAEAFKKRAKGLALDALDRLGEIALDPQSAAQHAIPAGKVIIEYAYGRPGMEKDESDEAGLRRLDELIGAISEAAKEE